MSVSSAEANEAVTIPWGEREQLALELPPDWPAPDVVWPDLDATIGDYEAAAMVLASKEPKPVNGKYDGQFWNHSKKEGFAEIAKDPEGWGREQLMGAIQRDLERTNANGR